MTSLRAAEFFAGIGLVRRALERAGIDVVFANDIDPMKMAVYTTNYSGNEFKLGDIAELRPEDVPDIDLATASFPCTDVSLAGNRAGLQGPESGTFWHLTDLLYAMGHRRPPTVLLENVSGLGTSKGGDDLARAVRRLNDLGYSCDLLELDARRWVPQSRKRVFLVGSRAAMPTARVVMRDEYRPPWVRRFVENHADLRFHEQPLPAVQPTAATLASVVQRLRSDDARWWDRERTQAFVESLTPLQTGRLRQLEASRRLTWRTAYRRTRKGKPVWEIRPDGISGCLRTARGGSSRQALVEAGSGHVRVRWMTSREYAALMGAADHRTHAVTENQALFGLGDAVCVPAVAWLVQTYVGPLARGELAAPSGSGRERAAATKAAKEESVLCLAT